MFHSPHNGEEVTLHWEVARFEEYAIKISFPTGNYESTASITKALVSAVKMRVNVWVRLIWNQKQKHF